MINFKLLAFFVVIVFAVMVSTDTCPCPSILPRMVTHGKPPTFKLVGDSCSPSVICNMITVHADLFIRKFNSSFKVQGGGVSGTINAPIIGRKGNREPLRGVNITDLFGIVCEDSQWMISRVPKYVEYRRQDTWKYVFEEAETFNPLNLTHPIDYIDCTPW